MKTRNSHELVKRHSGKLLLISFLFFIINVNTATSQGWGFTFQLTQSGPCGASIPGLPTFTVPNAIPTQGQCEALRQTILSVKISAPQYDNRGKYIGDCAVFYTCTPCTGSDIVVTGQSGPGEISLEGQYLGKPLYSPHESSAFEDWAKEYRQQLESYGITSILGNSLTAPKIPLTGNKDFDDFYAGQTANFNPTTTASSKPASQDANVVHLSENAGTVQLLTSQAEQAKRDKWYEEKGFDNLAPIGAATGIEASAPAEKDFKENSLRFAMENLPVVGTVAKGMLNIVDVVLGEDGLPKAAQQATHMDYEGGVETAEAMQAGVRKETANIMIETIKNSFVDPIKNGISSGVISVFKVGEKGEKAVGIVTGGVEMYQDWKGKNK